MLAPQNQNTFDAGMVRDMARHLIPTNALYDAENALMDDDGSAYKRAGTVFKTAAVAGSRVRQIWDGLLIGGQRTFYGTDSGFFTLAGDDVTPIALGGAGASGVGARWVAFRDVLYGPGGVMWGGSLKAADYSTGTVTVTNGSTTVTGAGTSWLANVDVGMLLQIAAAGPFYVVKAVVSDTQLTLKEAYQGSTAAAAAYALKRLGVAVLPSTNYPASFGAVALTFATVGNRLIVTDGSSRLWFTPVNNPYVWGGFDFHEIPGGVNITGLERARDSLLVFTTAGLWAVSNLALALTDPAGNQQQRVTRLSQETILWSAAGIAFWQEQLVVPTVNGVVMMDSQGPGLNIAGGPPWGHGISTVIRDYARRGFKPGGATVYDGHYLLPIVSGDTVIDLLVCRLDRPTGRWRGRRFLTSYPWSRLSGVGGQILAYAARGGQTSRPDLLGGSAGTSRIQTCRYTEPGAAVKFDADGSRFTFMLETRDYQTQPNENKATVRRCRVRYEMIDAAADDPHLAGFASVGATQGVPATWDDVTWDDFSWEDSLSATFSAMRGSAPEDDGRVPFTFTPGSDPGGGMMPGGIRGRYVRFRFLSSDPVAKLTVRELTFWTRPGRKTN